MSSVFDILTFAALFWIVCPLVAGAPWEALATPDQRAPFALEALGLVPLPAAFFGVLAAMMAGYLLFTSIAKAWYVRAHGELL